LKHSSSFDPSSFLVGESSAIKKIRKQAQQLASTSHNILIEGEEGVGKTRVARLIHHLKERNPVPFIGIDASTADQLKSFLPEKRSSRKPVPSGYDISTALGGSTIFLRRVSEWTFSQQLVIVELLNILSRRAKVRVIASVNGTLEGCKREETVDERLLGVFSRFSNIYVPPLRDRIGDIPALAQHFIAEMCKEQGLRPKELDGVALDFLYRHPWRGNVREVKQAVETCVLHSDGPSVVLSPRYYDEIAHLLTIIQQIEAKGMTPMDYGLDKIEELLLRRILEAYGYDQASAAEALGLGQQNLLYRLKKYRILRRWARTKGDILDRNH
jgi:DNA-binding NtrC family response regulator